MNKDLLNQITFRPLLDTLRLEDIDDAIYFSEKYAEYISNSRLGLINPLQGGCPKNFFEGLSKHNLYSDSLTLGSAVHEQLLQPESFFLCDSVDRPTAKLGHIADIVYKPSGKFPLDAEIIAAAAKVDYYNGLLTAAQLHKVKEGIKKYIKDRYAFEQEKEDSRTPIYLDPKMRENFIRCCEAINKDTLAQKLLHPETLLTPAVSENEKTILLDVEVTVPDTEPFVLRLKSKLDNYTINSDENTVTVNDLKTTGRRKEDFPKAFQDFHYYRELGMYSYLLSLCGEKFYGLKNPIVKSNCLVVETSFNNESLVYKVPNQELMHGMAEFKFLLKLVAYYKAYGY